MSFNPVACSDLCAKMHELSILDDDIDSCSAVSSPLASAVHLYLRHSGIKLRDSKVFPGLMSEKEKWLPFFPKAKKVNV